MRARQRYGAKASIMRALLACRQVHGNWYSPLERSRYSGWCMCQHSTTLRRRSTDIMSPIAQHLRDHQHHALLRDVIAFGVFLRVFADHGAVGDAAEFIDHHIAQTTVAADLDVGQGHAVLDRGTGVAAHDRARSATVWRRDSAPDLRR